MRPWQWPRPRSWRDAYPVIIALIALLVGFLVCALALLLAGNGSSSSPASSRPEYDCLGAQVACRKFVMAHLRAPATAKFGSRESGEYGKCVGPQKPGAPWPECYVVAGYVDAQNAFGALVLTYYECVTCPTTVREPWGKYRLESLTIVTWPS